MASVGDWRSPVLLIHGDDDRNVPFGETVDLVEQLRNQGVYYEQLIFPDEAHGSCCTATGWRRIARHPISSTECSREVVKRPAGGEGADCRVQTAGSGGSGSGIAG
jgi:acetyl esterase/lipase